MKMKLLLIAMVLALGVVGCGKKEESEGKAAQGGAEKSTQTAPAGVDKKVEDAAEVIEGNVESIEADVKKSEDDSTVSPEQLKASEAGDTEPQPSTGFVEEEVDVVEEKPTEEKSSE